MTVTDAPPGVTSSAQGEDRSRFQPVSGWGTNTFAFMKATEGLTLKDPDFNSNWANARAEGKIRGAYHFFHPGLSAVGQAAFFLETVAAQGIAPGDFLINDVEILVGADGTESFSTEYAERRSALGLPSTVPGTHLLSVTAAPDPATAASGALVFAEACHDAFGSHNQYMTYTNEEVGRTLGSVARWPLWIAFPSTTAPESLGPWKTWLFWQWAFGGGQGGGDQDAFNGDLAALQAFVAAFADNTAGPFRRVASGVKSLATKAAEQEVNVDTLYHLTMSHVNARNYARFEQYCGAAYPRYHKADVNRDMPAGLVYYTPK
jgi:GH25 family lysozyme M1 (1,4-beta-N-acetylmuramidase)